MNIVTIGCAAHGKTTLTAAITRTQATKGMAQFTSYEQLAKPLVEVRERGIVELITPVAAEVGLRFAIRDGGRTVGLGVVTKIVE